MESKLKHLEFIQNTIIRMSNNSFLIKGWSITIISALFALSAKDSNPKYFLISYIAIPIFWLLDGYYLSQERKFRNLYNNVCNTKENEINFNMNTEDLKNNRNSWICSMFSKTLLLFYITFILVNLIIINQLNIPN